MIEYTEEFCQSNHYRCLMPVEYELVEDGVVKTYKKKRCCCQRVLDGVCDKETECQHFKIAEEYIKG